MIKNEAQARLRINELLKKAGWRLLPDKDKKANVSLEGGISITEESAQGQDYEKVKNGKADYLLYDPYNKAIAVLEAKSEKKNPLDGKEQAREYAKGLGIKFIILSNGISHFFWELKEGCNPEPIKSFPTQKDLINKQDRSNPVPLYEEIVDKNYIAVTQYANLLEDPDYIDKNKRNEFIQNNSLKVLREYQLKAVHALQESAKKGNKRFLFEMATGTGKTLVSSAVIKLFLKTENVRRVLFLVDRLELEAQAQKSFKENLKNDFTTTIYHTTKENWKNSQIVICTIQRLLNRYDKDFSPFDFDLVISDEAHRSISGNSRAVFEYFLGYKLGLTATPKDYMKNLEGKDHKNIKSIEKRQLLDTYITFGCGGDRQPTFKYDLKSGVNEKFLINPFVIDARTNITTQLLDEEGFAVINKEEAEDSEERFYGKHFEKKFFNRQTNVTLCRHFLDHAQKDPFSNEIGKSIIFCVNQRHASKVTNILNKLASEKWPDKYESDFAVQITSNVNNTQEYAKNFANNNLKGRSKFLEGYATSRTRVCVTVSMMTTGYDCPDLLNICFMRPLFSPIIFIQMKGRGTRRHSFRYQNTQKQKEKFQIFDYFAVCEYFEKDFVYDKKLALPSISKPDEKPDSKQPEIDKVILDQKDYIKSQTKRAVPDIENLLSQATSQIKNDQEVSKAFKEDKSKAIFLVKEKYEDKPDLFFNLEKLRRSENLDRKISWEEFLNKVFDEIDSFETKDERLESLFKDYIITEKPKTNQFCIKSFFKLFAGDEGFRIIIENKDYGRLDAEGVGGGFSMNDLAKIKDDIQKIKDYIKTYIDTDQFKVA